MSATEHAPPPTPVLAVIDHHGETIHTTTGARMYEVFAGPISGVREERAYRLRESWADGRVMGVSNSSSRPSTNIDAISHTTVEISLKRSVHRLVCLIIPVSSPDARPSIETKLGVAACFCRIILIIGKHRTLIQDIRFAINQLVEVAIRALSPGINDPFTAITCIDQLGAALCQIANRHPPSSYQYDDKHHLRVIFKIVQFEELAGTIFNPIRHYGQTNAEVTLRLLSAISTVMRCTSNKSYRDMLIHQASIIAHNGKTTLSAPHEQKQVAAYYQSLLALHKS